MSDYTGRTDGLNAQLDEGVLRLTLDRPEKRNALTDDVFYALLDALTAAGCRGVAVSSCVCSSEDPVAVCRSLLAGLRASTDRA